MSKIIQKLNNLKSSESFIQVNTIRGYKYVDKAGEIVNTYYKDDVPPVFNMTIGELRIHKPSNKVEEIRVSPQMVWLRCLVVDSLDMVATTFTQESKKIFKILDVEKVSRIGWRNYFIYECDDKVDQDKIFEKIITIKTVKLNSINFEINLDKNFKVILGLQPVTKTDNNTSAVLFDIDISHSGEIDTKEVPKVLKEFREYLTAEKGFLDTVNNILVG
ncbi:MAG: hypothetical protein WC748_08225 [Legionellales bacterium]|jgi:hypothetical protein